MSETFEDLGIAPELLAAVEEMGWETPSALQEAAAPVIRRGNNVVLHGASGAGVTGAYGLPVLERLMAFEDADGPAGLVLTPSTADASRTAAALARMATPTGVSVRALAPGWPERSTRLLVASAADAMAAVRDSSLKLDGVSILVVAGADRIAAADGWGAVETLTELLAGEAQRIVVTGALGARLDDFIERHARKAMTLPSRPADRSEPDTSASVRYAIASPDSKLDALVALLPRFRKGEAAVVCRTQDGADEVARALTARGVDLQGEDDGAGRVLVLPLAEADQRSTRAVVVSYDVPFDAEILGEIHQNGGLVLVTPAQVQHLDIIAGRAGIQPLALPLPEPGSDAVEAARDRIRSVLQDVDLSAYLALIEPLLDEHPAAQVAAATAYLARRAPAQTEPAGGASTPAAAGQASSAAGAPPPSTAYVRLFLTIGSRDGAGPGDVVGAITGEAGIPGESVGRIDMRESHSTVEVASTDADKVIRSLNGKTLRGRSLRVDYDRKDRPEGGRGGPGGGAQRGGAGGGAARGGSGGRPGGRPGGGPGRGGPGQRGGPGGSSGRGAPRGRPGGSGRRPPKGS